MYYNFRKVEQLCINFLFSFNFNAYGSKYSNIEYLIIANQKGISIKVLEKYGQLCAQCTAEIHFYQHCDSLLSEKENFEHAQFVLSFISDTLDIVSGLHMVRNQFYTFGTFLVHTHFRWLLKHLLHIFLPVISTL